MKVTSERLEAFAVNCYEKSGIPLEDAKRIAHLQVLTDLRGVFSHGTRFIPSYIEQILKGEVNPRPCLRIIRDSISTCLLDADHGLGHICGTHAMQIAMEKAKKTGMGAVAVQNSTHYGAAACFSMMALSEGMIGFTTSQTGHPTVTPFGGVEGILDNAPLSYAIPTKDEPPLVVDMACGVSAWGRIQKDAREGRLLPTGWALNSDGQPTQDPNKADVLLPFGGVKGFGLNIIMSIISGLLKDTPSHTLEMHDPKGIKQNHFFCAIHIEHICPFDAFVASVDDFIRNIRASRPQSTGETIKIPGERAYYEYQKALSLGIDLDDSHISSLRYIANVLSLDIPF